MTLRRSFDKKNPNFDKFHLVIYNIYIVINVKIR